jgi:hypothetical protein
MSGTKLVQVFMGGKKKEKAYKILQLRNETKSKPNNTANHQKIKQVLVVAGGEDRKDIFDQERFQIP